MTSAAKATERKDTTSGRLARFMGYTSVAIG